MPFRIVLHTVFFIVFRLNQEYIQKKLNLNNFFWEFSRNLFAPQSLCVLFERASDFVFFQLYADVASWFSKKGGGTTDAIHIISEKAGTAVAGSRILALERQKKFENSTKRREFSRGLFCPVERILRSLVCYLESYACHDLAIIFFFNVACELCTEQGRGGGLLLSSETSRDECRAAQTYF